MTPRYIPTCPSHIAPVDQYMWATKDTSQHICNNGISHPIYNCKGDIHFSLPLHMYPKVGEIHSQIQPVSRNLHTNLRKNIVVPYPSTSRKSRRKSPLEFSGVIPTWTNPPYTSNNNNPANNYAPDNFSEDPYWKGTYQRGGVPNYPREVDMAQKEYCCGRKL
ncbi:MAG TPA: hypothetical protein VLE02_00985 [Nitrosarchaeum sp.]|nr:hypothetical protein [Nitrosarchaeum sp.]